MNRKSWFFVLFALFALFSACKETQLTRKVTIFYKKDYEDTVSVLSFAVNDGSYLVGSPFSWGDHSWYEGSTGDYGYETQSGQKYFFHATGDDSVYTFYYSSSAKEFKTSQPVTEDLVLYPKYLSTSSSVIVSLEYKTSNRSVDEEGRVTYNTLSHVYEKEIPISSNGTYAFDTRSLINEIRSSSTDSSVAQIMDPEVCYGYVDYNDHAKRYCLYPDTTALYDNKGNVYDGNVEIDSDVTLHFDYVDGGYDATLDYFGFSLDVAGNPKPVYLPVVFVPGTRDEKGIEHPWPNSQGEIDGNNAVSQLESSATIPSLDTKDYKHPVGDMLVCDATLTQGFILELMKNSAFNDKFRFYTASKTDAFQSGVSYGGDVGWDGCTWYDCKVMANMMTYIYNQAHEGIPGFVPLSYVYKDLDGNVLCDAEYCNTQPVGSIVCLTDDTANGFRLLKSYEWEYCAKVVTDERCLPDFEKSDYANEVFHKKGDSTSDYRFYFQSTNEAGKSIYESNPHYSGSGAGLATCISASPYIIYNQGILRTGARALGRDADTSARVFNGQSFVRTDVNGDLDYNTRNGAGLFNMCGYMWNLCDTFSNFSSSKVVLRGGDYNCSQRFYPGCLRCENMSINSVTTLRSNFSVRLVRAL